MNYKDTIKGKREEAKAKDKSQKDLLTLIYYLKKANISAPTDFSERVKELSDNIVKSVSSLKLDDSIGADIKSIASEYKSISNTINEQNKRHYEDFGKMLALFAEVIQKEKSTDFTPLIDAIQNIVIEQPEVHQEKKELDLDDFKAQDIKESGEIQYIGFECPEGKWYIVENNTEKNTLRYVFGDKNYRSSFKKAASWEYKTLSEAINEISA